MIVNPFSLKHLSILQSQSPFSMSAIILKPPSKNISWTPLKLPSSMHIIIRPLSSINILIFKPHSTLTMFSTFNKLSFIKIPRIIQFRAFSLHFSFLKFSLINPSFFPIISAYSMKFIVSSISLISVSIIKTNPSISLSSFILVQLTKILRLPLFSIRRTRPNPSSLCLIDFLVLFN